MRKKFIKFFLLLLVVGCTFLVARAAPSSFTTCQSNASFNLDYGWIKNGGGCGDAGSTPGSLTGNNSNDVYIAHTSTTVGGPLTVGNQDTITIQSNADLNLTASDQLTVNSGGEIVVANAGTLNVGGNGLTVGSGGSLVISGTVNVTDEIVVEAGGSIDINNGFLKILNGGVVRINAGTISNNSGNIEITGGSLLIDSGGLTISGTGSLDLIGGQITISPTGSLTSSNGSGAINIPGGYYTNANASNYAFSGTVGEPIDSYDIKSITDFAGLNFNAASLITSSWSVSGLPEGLSINSSSGVISGVPTESGTGTVVVSGTEGTATIYQTISYTISAPPDVTPPTIVSVSSDVLNGTYDLGALIDIDITFSENVTSTGNVTVTLETGDVDRTCTFAISNETTGTCTYTVQAGDTSADLTVTSISGTIADQSGNAMSDFTPTTNLADNKALVIVGTDNTNPTITSVSSDKANGIYRAGDSIDIDVTFSEAVTSTGEVTVTLETGAIDRTCAFTVSNGTTGTCDYNVQAGDETADLTVASISGTIADQSGNALNNFTPTTNLATNKAIVIDAIVTWTERTGAGLRYWYTVASSLDGNNLVAGIAAGGTGYIYTSTNAGATWTEQTGSGVRQWYGVASSEDGQKLAAVNVNSGYIYTSTDGGVNWTEQTGSGSRTWTDITSSVDGAKLAAVAYNGYIYTSTDGGVNWTEQTGSGSRTWIKVDSSADGVRLVAIPATGYIYTSTDGGVNWTEQTGSGSRTWTDVAMSADGTKILAGSSIGIYRSTDLGVTWSTPTSVLGFNATNGYWRTVAMSSDGSKMAATRAVSSLASASVFTSQDSGDTWTNNNAASGNRNWSDIASSADGTKLVATVSRSGTTGYIYTALVVAQDTTNPVITYVSSDKADGTYDVGETIDIDVTFSENVTSTGNVTVTLETGDVDRTCTFTVADSDTGTCTYTVQAGDTSADLTVTSISGTIADQSGNAMSDFSIETNLAINKALVIETTPDTIPGSEGGGSSGSTQSYRRDATTDTTGDTRVSTTTATTTTTTPADTTTPDITTTITRVDTILTTIRSLLADPTPDVVTLTELIAELKTIFATLETNTPTDTTPTTTTFTTDLSLGMNHPDVQLLQQFLNRTGFIVASQGAGSVGRETTFFGYATEAALIQFQRFYNITPAVGFFGAVTRGVVNGMMQ